jgi:N-acetylmuramoyl-L-alanine amidase
MDGGPGSYNLVFHHKTLTTPTEWFRLILMIPDRPSQKGCAARWIPILLIGWILMSPDPSSIAGRSPETLYKTGQICRDRLLSSPKLKKYRHNWEKCIRNFNGLLDRFPNDSLVEKTLFSLGQLYSGLYRYSKNPGDLEKSVESYHRLISEYPGRSLARAAQERLNHPQKGNQTASFATIQNIRHWTYSNYTRLVLDADRNIDYRADNPDGELLRITLNNTRISPEAKNNLAALSDGLLQRVTLRPSATDEIQVIINVKNLKETPKIIPLGNPDRLVIDLFGPNTADGSNSPVAGGSPAQDTSSDRAAFAQALPVKIRTIVIDPGHGGKDPGAIGRTGLTEKDIVLDIGLQLRSLIQDRLNKKVIMTRDDDTFIPLDDRTLMANSKNADLFVSIHVNSHPQRSTRGVEIYHLGQSSDRHAMAVAARENNVSIQSLGHLDRTVKQILFDLGREYNIDQSQTLAYFTRQAFQRTLENRYNYVVVDHGVKRAPFYVLLNSNMPSILAEVSFISNPKEEQLLRDKKYRQGIAESLFQGIRAYLSTLEPMS